MIFEIYSFGDVLTLNQIFNAISIIFQDSGYTSASVAVLTFMLGGMTIANFVGGAKELPYGQLFAGMLVFGMGFGTYTSVSIENRYTSLVTQIDNIPIAVAVPASLISGVGFWITEKTEAAFANLDSQKITTNGYLSPLKTIANLRKASYFDECPAGITASTGTYNLCYSLRSYMADCAMVKVARDNHALQMRKGNIIDEINFHSEAYATYLVKASGVSEYKSCKDAYDLLKTDLGHQHEDMLDTMLAQLGIRSGEKGIDKLSDAMEAIGVNKSKAKDLAYSMFLDKNAADGTLDYLHKIGASDLAENYSSSIQQRNYEWSLQANMFTQILNQFLSLMEAVIFAIAPFIGLMALTGPTGMKSLMLYVQMILVINFIPPMLVIVQNITLAEVANYAKSLEAQGMVIGSLDYMDLLTKKTHEMMGVGGMVATTIVPALAMAMVTGSGMALMGAMRGAAVAPKDTDAVSQHIDQGGVTNLGNTTNSHVDRFNNAWTDAGKASVIDITDSTQLSTSLNSAKVDSQSAQSTWKETSSNVVQTMKTNGLTTNDAHSMGEKVTTSSSHANEWTSNTVDSLVSSGALTETDAKALTGAVGVAASAGIDLGSFFELGANGKLEGSFADTLTQSGQETVAKMIQNGDAEKIAQSFNQTMESAGVDTSTISTGNEYLDGEKYESQNARDQARSKEQKYQEAMEISRSLTLENTDNEALQHLIANHNTDYLGDSASSKIINTLVSDEKDKNFVRSFYSNLEDNLSEGGMYLDENTAKLAAYSTALKDHNRMDEMFDVISRSGYYSSTSTTTDKNDKEEPTKAPPMGKLDIQNLRLKDLINKPDGTLTEKVTPNEASQYKDRESEVPTEHSPKYSLENRNKAIIAEEASQLLQAYSDANVIQGDANKAIKDSREITSRDILEDNVVYQSVNGFKDTLEGYLSGHLSEKDVYESFKEGFGINAIDNLLKDGVESYFKTMIGEQHALISGQAPDWTPDERTANDIEYMRSQIESAKNELHKTGYSPEDNLDNKAKLAHYQQQLKFAESGEHYTTSFNWKPSEEPSYIDKKLLEQEKQEASEGLSVLQYNARSVNATDRDKEAYDNALNKVLFTSEQIENINSGQAYQTKEGGPTYSSSTMSQQKEHLSRLEGMVNNAGNDGSNTNEYRAWINEQIHNMQSGKEYKMEKGSDDTFKGLFVPFDVPR